MFFFTKTTINLENSQKTMVDYCVNFDPFRSIKEYCDGRIAIFETKGIKSNSNYKGIYRSFIVWFDQNHPFFPMVDAGENQNLDNTADRPLETRTSRQGTVYITQYNVEQYFRTAVVNMNTSSRAVVRKKVSALTWFLQNVEDRTAAALDFSPPYTSRYGGSEPTALVVQSYCTCWY
jgi:hypothetical protein